MSPAEQIDEATKTAILCQLYRARSAELDTKGLLSYLLWASLLAGTLILYVLHFYESNTHNAQIVAAFEQLDVSPPPRMSIFVAIYPFFLLGMLGCIIYSSYKLRLLWLYLAELEDVIISFAPEPGSENDDAPSMKAPLWARSIIDLKTLGRGSDRVIYPVIELVLIVVFTVIVTVTGTKALDALGEGAAYPFVTATIYLACLGISYIVIQVVYWTLRGRVNKVRTHGFPHRMAFIG